MSSRRAFRSVLVLLALFVLVTGVLEIVVGPSLLPGNNEVSPTVDSNYRFFAAIWCALGVVLMAAAKDPDAHAPALRAVFGAVFLGGVARAVSYVDAGAPHAMLTAFIGVELLLPPLLLLWYSRTRVTL
ncbi:DUF4345 domain-containing protein [Streptomyces sp. WAC05374]|uniref:DUF4345 domain-containing protein n=1 Tax=Streptomyces sp. WAC05374 TaxID=2487420 RepID=UPI000F88FBC5|nr:DUF4345 domain-containing protein [Streptomyces sp. WAC05374]RST19234.1 DUF4345 domain-containing protein [Streptomyces sp. WAC05374]TDF50434.1 DUF4345 domain-containing protein [Streptomyces sp. WAC05374]TDF51801.1 DUF4345 domain-containing protein [Streptomyces sp. WAC05374]TDF60687.1 DUF4345 domain-containing protein [Streptomyces sp. WAC05374]